MSEEKKLKNHQNSIITSIDSDSILEVNLDSRILATAEISKSNVLWADKEQEDFIFKIFCAIKDDLGWVSLVRNLPIDVFERISNVLFQCFWEAFKINKDIEKEIEKEIEQLKDYEYIIDLDINTLEYITITLEDIKNMLVSLRDKRIQFYEALLEEYRKRKSEYDKRLKKDLKFHPNYNI